METPKYKINLKTVKENFVNTGKLGLTIANTYFNEEGCSKIVVYQLTDEQASKVYCCNDNKRKTVYLCDDNRFHALIDVTLLILITEEEYLEKKNSYIKWKEEKLLEKRCNLEKVFIEPKGSLSDKTFNFEEKQGIDTNYNFANLGIYDSNEQKFTSHQSYYLQTCCAFVKTKRSVDIYIPKIYLNYFGYTTKNLIEWLKFLKRCNFGFNYIYGGLSAYPECVIKSKSLPPTDDNLFKHEDYIVKQFAPCVPSVIFPNIESKAENFHRIILINTDSDANNYLNLICLRYIYNSYYWTIPGHAMQIKKALGTEITSYHALLLAHTYKPYDDYYCMVSQKQINPNFPHKKNGLRTLQDTPLEQNFNRHVNPFQKKVIDMFRLKDYMIYNAFNQYLEHFDDVMTFEETQPFFKAKDWVGLCEYVKSKTKEKQISTEKFTRGY